MLLRCSIVLALAAPAASLRLAGRGCDARSSLRLHCGPPRASSPVLTKADLNALLNKALAAAKTGDLKYASNDDKQPKDEATQRAAVARDLQQEFRKNPDRILKVTDALLKERFYRSTALLKAFRSEAPRNS